MLSKLACSFWVILNTIVKNLSMSSLQRVETSSSFPGASIEQSRFYWGATNVLGRQIVKDTNPSSTALSVFMIFALLEMRNKTFMPFMTEGAESKSKFAKTTDS